MKKPHDEAPVNQVITVEVPGLYYNTIPIISKYNLVYSKLKAYKLEE